MTLTKRPFGQTGEETTAIGLGSGFLNKVSFQSGVETVQRALELGVSYFDTSPHYGYGASQAIFGEALANRSEDYLVATKLGYFGESDHFRSPVALAAQLNENLRLLRRFYVDVLQIHEANWQAWWSDEMPVEGRIRPDIPYDFANAPILQFLQSVKQEGKCRFIGITGNNADEVARVLKQVEVDAVLVAFNYDLIWRGSRRQALPIAHQKGVAFIGAAVLQNGRLVQPHPEWLQTPPDWMTAEVQSRLTKLYAIQQECGLSLVTLTIRFLMAHPTVSTILVGAAKTEEIEACVAAAQAGPLPTELHQAVEDLGLEDANPAWEF